MKIYHNPRCRKSRETLQIIHDKNVSVDVVEYLQTPLKAGEIGELMTALGKKPIEVIRKGEKIYKEIYKAKADSMSDADWLKAMEEHPILIERPIVLKNKKAVLGRPPENVLDLLN